MAQSSKKYAALPDFDDTAPEFYETQAVNEDSSSRRTSSITSVSYYSPSPSASPSPSDDESGTAAKKPSEHSGVDRHHQIPAAEARSRFRPARVDAENVDFSDRIHKPRRRERHRSYQASSKQRSNAKKVRRKERTREATEYEATGEESEGSSVVSEDETLEERIARLKREVEEVKGEAEKGGDKEGDNKRDFGIAELSDILRDVSLAKSSTIKAQRSQQSSTQAEGEAKQQDDPQNGAESTGDIDLAGPLHLPQRHPDLDANTLSTLHKASTLESRLSTLENALGLHNLAVPLPSSNNTNSITTQTTTTTTSKTTTTNTSTTQPILTTLTLLERQLQHLTTTHLPTLTTASSTLQKLTTDADKLTESRKAATQAAKDLSDANANAALLMQQQNARPSYHRAGQDSFDASRPSTAATAATRISPTKSSFFPARRPSSMSFAAAPGGGTATPGVSQEPEGLTPEQADLLKRLAAHLPVVDALAPLLPLTLERLKSLSRVHVDAGTALGDLKELERRQGEMSKELREWREGLVGLEGRVREVGERGNRGEVERWVGEIEGRVERLGSGVV
ncbi:MAG: hypothetical protein M1831_000945 [Alyxoria varia]|nr:MAG: hypothetical protein M1831_000945 [Alyxoria varia]